MSNIAFIVGTGRCGSTMLSQMLNSHSLICVPFELQILFEHLNNGTGLYEVFKEKKNENFGAKDFIELIESKSPHKYHEYFDYRQFFEKQHYPIRSLKELVNTLFSEIAESQHKKLLIKQTPWYGQKIDILNELFPNAKYIHLIRDGRDVAISFARTPWASKDIGENLERWHTEVNKIIKLSHQFLKYPNRMLQIRYEDFVARPEYGLKRICNFLKIDFEEAMLDPTTYINYESYYKCNIENISSSSLNTWSKNKTRPTFIGSCFAWRRYPDFDFSNIPKHITLSLNSLGYNSWMSRFYTFLKSLLRDIPCQ